MVEALMGFLGTVLLCRLPKLLAKIPCHAGAFPSELGNQ